MKFSLGPNDSLVLELESPHVNGSYHVAVPFTVDGLIMVRQILRDRARSPEAKIGTKASPTQEMVNHFMRTHERKAQEAAKANPHASLINLSELGL